MRQASSPSPPCGVPAVATAAAPPGVPLLARSSAPSSAQSSALSSAQSSAPPSPTIADVLRAQRSRIDGWTPVKVAAFISHLGTTGSVTQAAAYVQMSTVACYALRNRPGGEPFAEAWETAIGARHEMLADIALDRVRDGVERTRWHQGVAVGVDRIFSDRLLIHMLDATDPDRRARRAPRDNGPEPDPVGDSVPKSFDSGIPGRLTASGTDGPADSDLHAAFAAELDDDLPPDVVAEMANNAERRRAAVEASTKAIAAIGAGIDAALRRPPAA